MEQIIVASFDKKSAAQDAVLELVGDGFERNNIRIAADDRGAGRAQPAEPAGEAANAENANGAAVGVGAVLGGVAGLLVSVGALLAASPLATTLAGAGVGAAVGGVISALVDAGGAAGEARRARAARIDPARVTVYAAEEMVSRATDILHRYGATEIVQRAAAGLAQGQVSSPAAAAVAAPAGVMVPSAAGRTQFGPIVSGVRGRTSYGTGTGGMSASGSGAGHYTDPKLAMSSSGSYPIPRRIS